MAQTKTPQFFFTLNEVEQWAGPSVDRLSYANLLIAFATCWRASSNTVSLANDNMLIGLGCGQQDRIECVRLALGRARSAGHSPIGAYFASDAFFPYTLSEKKEISDDYIIEMIKTLVNAKKTDDLNLRRRLVVDSVAAPAMALDNREGTELLIDAGCAGGVVTADGKELPNVMTLFEKSNLSVAFVNAQNRGFSKH